MTQTTVNPATVASYSADDIKRQLVAGRTVQQVADRTGWPRQRVTAIINGVKGWMLDPGKDTVYQPDNPGMLAQLPDGVDPGPARLAGNHAATEAASPVPDLSIELKQPAALLALIGRTLGMLSGFEDATVAKEIGRANTALVQLEDALTIGERRRQAEADLAAAEQVVADAKARLKLLKSGRIPAASTSPVRIASPAEPTPKEIRAWAAEHGIECAPNGKIPGPIRQQYDTAHNKEDATR
jgi:hypothetical protein